MTEKNKNKGGRPPHFKTVEDFTNKFNIYVKFCNDNKDDEIPDVEGLCYHCGITRSTLFDYKQKPEFSDAIKRTLDWVAYKKKQLALKGKIAPAIFCFDFKNNHGYTDRQEITQTTRNIVVGSQEDKNLLESI